MKNYELPYGMNRYDCLEGTVVSMNSRGITVRLNDTGCDDPLYAFVFGGGRIGDLVLVSLRSFNDRHGRFIAGLDSVLKPAA